jgi:hypothetical protein
MLRQEFGQVFFRPKEEKKRGKSPFLQVGCEFPRENLDWGSWHSPCV